MNIRTRIGKLEITVGRCLPLRELSDAQLEARIRAAAGLGDDVQLTDELLRALSEDAHAELTGGDHGNT